MSQMSNSYSISLDGVLFFVFLVLKLIGKIDWSWWWVTAPLWIPLSIAMVILIMGLIFILFKND